MSGRSRKGDVWETICTRWLRRHEGIVQLYSELPLDDVLLHRDESCLLYESCLDHASGKRWESFSCILCYGEPGIPIPRRRPPLLVIIGGEEEDEE